MAARRLWRRFYRNGEGKASGVTVAWSYWRVATIVNDKVMRAEWLPDRTEALEAAGLSE